jgi:hypothetical protein
MLSKRRQLRKYRISLPFLVLATFSFLVSNLRIVENSFIGTPLSGVHSMLLNKVQLSPYEAVGAYRVVRC